MHARRLMAALTLVAAVGCGGGGGEAGPVGSVSVTVSPTSLTLPQGGNGTVTVTLTRGGGFADPVNVSVEGLPAGVTASLSPAQLTGSTTQAVVTVNVAGTVAAGTYTATVRASAAGVGAATVQYSLTVTAVGPAPNVSFATSPAALSIAQGASGTATLNVTRTAYPANITPTVAGNPAGMTVAFSPNPITANSSQVAVNVGAGVAAGTYNVVIAAAGVAGNPSTTLAVTVTSSGGGGNIVWEFCNDEAVPLKFWRKSNGSWAEVTATVAGNVTRYTFSALGNEAGVAWVFQRLSSSASARRDAFAPASRQARKRALSARAGSQSQDVGGLVFPHFETNVLYATSSELASRADVCQTSTAPVSKTFTVTGMGSSEVGALGYGPGAAALTSSQGTYNVMVPAGTYDWMAAFAAQPMPPDLIQNWSHYRIGRGEAAPGGTVSIDRVGATAFVPAPFAITGGNPGTLYSYIHSITGARKTIISLPIGSPIGTTPSGNMLFLASGDRLTSDLNLFIASNFEAQGANNVSSRALAQFLGSSPPAGSTTFALPPAVPSFTVTQVMGGPYPTWTVTGATPASFQTEASSVTVSYQGAGETTLVFVMATRNWLVSQGQSTNYSISGPASLPGFLSQWAPASPLIDTDVTLFGSNISGGTPVVGSVNVTSYLFRQPPN